MSERLTFDKIATWPPTLILVLSMLGGCQTKQSTLRIMASLIATPRNKVDVLFVLNNEASTAYETTQFSRSFF